MISKSILVFLVSGLTLSAACISVAGDQIMAADLVAINPVFATLNPHLTVSYSPVPGKRRTIGGSEITQWAQMNNLLEFHSTEPVCFERVSRTLTSDEVSQAILKNFSPDHLPKVEVLDFTKTVLATGRLEFPRSGASSPPTQSNSAVLWRGRVVDENNTSFPVWVRLKITIDQRVLRFKQSLPMGHVLGNADLEEAMAQVCALGPLTTPDKSLIIGQSLKRSVQAGALLVPDLVQPTPDIAKGDVVRVEVVSGAARINFEAKAETSGRIGDYIMLTNPVGTERFKAKIITASSVQVIVTPKQGNSLRG